MISDFDDGAAMDRILRHGSAEMDRFARERDETFRLGLETAIALCLVQLHTTFEVFTRDLWIAGMNLASATDARKFAESSIRKGGSQPKSFSMEVLAKYDFDLKGKFGTVFSNEEKVGFDSANEIKRSYQDAFGPRIESAFSGRPFKNIRVLETIRNVVIHNSWRVDERFAKHLQSAEPGAFFESWTKLEVGTLLKFDGRMVNLFLGSVVRFCEDLANGVEFAGPTSKQ